MINQWQLKVSLLRRYSIKNQSCILQNIHDSMYIIAFEMAILVYN